MIATVSPHVGSVTETWSTLLFADRAKKIKNKATVNKASNDLVDNLQEELRNIKKELAVANNDVRKLKEGLPEMICSIC